jgi:hypothetical protein
VFVEYAKEAPEDVLIRVTVNNRGPDAADLHLLPTLWFRNDWASWIARPSPKPLLKEIEGPSGTKAVAAMHTVLGAYHLYCAGDAPLLFTENSTNHAALHFDYPDVGPYLKDGINNYVVHGRHEAVNPRLEGTKAAAHYQFKVAPGQSVTIRLRLIAQALTDEVTNDFPFGQAFENTFATRLKEADDFYKSVTPPSASPDAASVMRQALAGALWSKQYYYWDGDAWLDEHHAHPLHRLGRRRTRACAEMDLAASTKACARRRSGVSSVPRFNLSERASSVRAQRGRAVWTSTLVPTPLSFRYGF